MNLTVKLNNDKFFTAQQSDFIEKMLIDIVIRLKVNRKTHVQLTVNYWQVDQVVLYIFLRFREVPNNYKKA